MLITQYRRSESAPRDDIRAALEGSIFHVTRIENLPLILADGAIRPNADATFLSTFGYTKNSYFRNRGCVSLFDYRIEPPTDIDYRLNCHPFQPARPPSPGIAIMFLDPDRCGELVPWIRWKEENALSETVAPHVEIGHRGPVPISAITRTITLQLDEDPNSIAAIYRNAEKRRSS